MEFTFDTGIVAGILISVMAAMIYSLLNHWINYGVDLKPIFKDNLGYSIYTSKLKTCGQPTFYEVRFHGHTVVRIPTDFYGEGNKDIGVTVRHLQCITSNLQKSNAIKPALPPQQTRDAFH